MKKEILDVVRNNPLIYSYLREDSLQYKYLLKDSSYIKEVERLSKEKYKQSGLDMLDSLKDKIELIGTFIDVLK